MPLMVSNTLTSGKVEFKPKDGNTVRWYICGPTVYDSSHLGHARTYVAFDVIRRILENFFGFDIFCVMNITDVDDKIILRARRNHLLKIYKESCPPLAKDKLAKLEEDLAKETKSVRVGDLLASKLDEEQGAEIRDQQIFRSHAAFYEQEYHEDMKSLGVRPPDVLTRVTEFIPQIVSYIQKIIDNGFAYEAQGSVYFDIRSFSKTHSYRKLSWNEASMLSALAEAEGALSSGEGKRTEFDFALWKKSKPGEPSWESPWGGGRPGWHIECSVMASEILGDTLDIHGGGIDLCFPHHDNELAQAEAYYGHQQWVNYFLHSGHLYIGYQKMSKSLKNFFTIREILKGGSTMKVSEEESVVLPAYSPRQLRILFMMHEWDKPMYFSKDTLDVAVGKEKTFKEFFGAVKAMAREDVKGVSSLPQAWGEAENVLNRKIEDAQKEIAAALADNFNTPQALLRLQDLVTSCNIYMNSPDARAKFLLVNKAAVYISKIFRVLGIDDNGSDFPFLTSAGAGGDEEVLSSALDAFCSLREDIRAAARAKEEAASAGSAASDYLELCDRVRDDVLPAIGVRLEDRPDGFLWKLDDPEVLARERQQKLMQAAEAQKKKVENKLEKVRKELEKWSGCSVAAGEMFKPLTDKYSKFDDQGIPTHNAAGEELSKKQRQASHTLREEQLKALTT
ncbi:cysteinyl-tRNA synthetase [Guillardia theta CCMP2712]|uniref:cysteine--tRNA ligase n=1 Tax=Guillardia theta (strain CCMP2712) TaxID=905079 RepID=L1K2A7_GUITC|nr:cysteinyl-tRNA synthetase [Guillardia theta CCMP2712]EKX54961.1 cysteinyl-tRNA synthetase [Guillardia theta CCMP2712]|eukprot:XP_005841941.1 cysteinyl-tRNA synthetase [Guillardia theta CCMP2712]